MSKFTEIKINVCLAQNAEVIHRNSNVSTFQAKDSIKGVNEQAKPAK